MVWKTQAGTPAAVQIAGRAQDAAAQAVTEAARAAVPLPRSAAPATRDSVEVVLRVVSDTPAGAAPLKLTPLDLDRIASAVVRRLAESKRNSMYGNPR